MNKIKNKFENYFENFNQGEIEEEVLSTFRYYRLSTAIYLPQFIYISAIQYTYGNSNLQ